MSGFQLLALSTYQRFDHKDCRECRCPAWAHHKPDTDEPTWRFCHGCGGCCEMAA